MNFIANARDALGNFFNNTRNFGGLFISGNTKHDYGKDYGWPDQLAFPNFYQLYTRSSLAKAAVKKTIGKTWESNPNIWEGVEPNDSEIEKSINDHFTRKNLWRALSIADERSMVGAWSAAILILKDGLPLGMPVGRVADGIEGLVSIIPAWEGQMFPVEWDNDPLSIRYGEPTIYQYIEQAVGNNANPSRAELRVHHERVLIFSDDGTIHGMSPLMAGYNDVIDADKIKGAGGEGFWKSSRGAPIIQSKDGVSPEDIRKAMGVGSNSETLNKVNEQVHDFQAGYDAALMLGGFTVDSLAINLPQPKEFWDTCVQAFAASMNIPFKILVGNITGERASTEDAHEWARTNMARRNNRIKPVIQELIDRLVRWGALSEIEWHIGWDDLTEASALEKMDQAVKMADINQKGGAEMVFLPDEIRQAAGFAAGEEVEGFEEFMAEREERAREIAEDGPIDSDGDLREEAE